LEKYADVIRKSLHLADTCLQGLEHAKNSINEGRFEDGLIMLHDAVQGYYQMEKALVPVLTNLPGNNVGPLSEALHRVVEYDYSVFEPPLVDAGFGVFQTLQASVRQIQGSYYYVSVLFHFVILISLVM